MSSNKPWGSETCINRFRGMTPPPALTEPVPQPTLRGKTIGQALATIPDLRGALRTCNGRLGDVRRWAEGQGSQEGE